MTTTTAVEEMAAAVATATAVVSIGAGTHAEIGGRVTDATEVRAPSGIVDVQPFDMTVSVRAGTPYAELDAALAEHGQESPLDPLDASATVGGIIAAGLSGLRRLGHGPLRDHLLEVEFVTADGKIARGGGPTVKNVTGYDIPRLFVGSLGTLGVITRVILRTRPCPAASEWFESSTPASVLRGALFAPTAIVRAGDVTAVLLEGNATDLRAEAEAAALAPAVAPASPAGAHRARIAIDPARLDGLLITLDAIDGLESLAEYGVGTVHVASATASALIEARRVAEEQGGWMLRISGAPDLDPFGVAFPALELQRRIRRTLDPTGKLNPGRVRATESR